MPRQRRERWCTTLFAAFGLVGANAAQGQVIPDSTGPWIRESWTVRDGLPVNALGTLIQSRDGYIWATTLDGLVRYDGVRFTVFNSSVTSAIPTNRIITGLAAGDGSLWFRTERMDLIRYHEGRFTHLDRSSGLNDGVIALSRDSTGNVWVGTRHGLGVMHGDRFEPVDTVLGGSQVVRRRDGSTWIGTFGRGVLRSDSGPATPIPLPGMLDPAIVLSMFEDPTGTLWLGTNQGLWIEHQGTVRRIDSERQPLRNTVGLAWSSARQAVYAYSERGVYRIDGDRVVPLDTRRRNTTAWAPMSLDAGGNVWYATGPELFRDGKLVHRIPDIPGVAPAEITNILIDREGGIWLASSQGLERIKPALFRTFSVDEGLRSRNVYPIVADARNQVWAGTWGGGLSRIDSGGSVTTFPPGKAFPFNIHALALDSSGRIWIAGNTGLRVCELPAMQCREEATGHDNLGETYALYFDRAGRLWNGRASGIVRKDRDGWIRVPGWSGTHPVRVFLETTDGALWIGTNGDGIARWANNSFTTITTADGLPSDLVRSLHQDGSGTLWVGTEGRGLAALDPLAWKPGSGHTNQRIISVTARDGLYDESIHQILEDAGGRFWINTNRGVFWLPRAELQDFVAGRVTQVHSTSYTERDGLRNREGNGGYFPAGAKTGDGRLWFPTQDGVVAIDPRRLRPGALPPAVVERVVAGDSAFIADDGTITLDVTRRDLRIEYTASSFVGPANVRFRYRMEPYDRDWVDAGNRRVAFYTKVPPGRYRFRVEAGTGMGDWNEAGGATLALSLAARPWETTWFRALVLAFAGFLLGLAMRSRTRRLHRRADELELIVAERTSELSTRNTQLAQQTVQLAELDRAKTRFFANVSHEFRTPLTLTIGPLENLRTRAGDDGEAGRWIDLALRNARRLLRLVNQILDVAKLEAGQMRLAVRRFDLVPFARGVTAVFETAAAQRGITLRVDTPDSLIGVFDPDALEKIMTNLLSNAIKFTPRDGVVSVALVAEGPRICLAVKDTGPGIPDHQLEHVFERFYQADETTIRREPGTGIGLSLVKELVDLHGGTIAVESGNGHAGTTFTVLLPLEHGVGTMTPIIPPTPSKPEAVNRAEENGETPGEDDVPALLVVDDSEDLRVWIREHFARRFRVYEAADGAEGITLARQHLPDMVISDVMMPGTDGFALCRALREQPETDFLPIILLTAQAGSQQRIEGFERGADDYLTKPFEMRELEARVDNLIALRRRLRERYQREATETSSIVFRGQPTGLTPDDQALVSRIRAAIEANLTNPDFGVAELAKAVFLDRSHLFRRSRELLDTAPSDLLRRARLERAARLLETGAGTVAEVAYAVGFNKVSHFCHLFQAAYGATPAAWRSRVEAK